MVIKYRFTLLNEYINQCRRNVFLANKTKQKETELTKYYFINEKKVKNYPIKIVFNWHIKNKLSDLDGRMCKCILDGMVQAGIIEDDCVKYINQIEYNYIADKEDYVEIEIIEKEKGNESKNNTNI